MLTSMAHRPGLTRAITATVGVLLLASALAVMLASPAPVLGRVHSVTIGDGFFGPANLTITVGDTVTWTNADDSLHSATGEGAISSGNLDEGQSYSKTFTAVGTFDYVCIFHDDMVGTITVVAAAAAPAPPAPAPPGATPTPAPAAGGGGGGGGAAGGGGVLLPNTATSLDLSGSAPLLIGLGLLALALGILPARQARSRDE